MSVIVETGTGNILATSYVSEADLSTYASARGITLVGNTTSLLIQAMDYLEAQQYIGLKVKDNLTQVLQWPRSYVLIDGWYTPFNTIPYQLPKAQCAIACAIDAGNGPLIDLPRRTKSEKVGDLEVVYANGSPALVINRIIANELHKLLINGGGIVVSKA